MSDQGNEAAPPPPDEDIERLAEFRRFQDLTREHGWPIWAPTWLMAYARVPDLREAAKAAGIDRGTARRLVIRDEYFADAAEEAKNTALDRLETSIFIRSTIGAPVTKTVTKTVGDVTTTTVIEERHVSDVLAMFYLKRYRPEFREAYRVEQSGPDGGPMEVTIEERVHAAAERFNAEVVRLADARGANGSSRNGSG